MDDTGSRSESWATLATVWAGKEKEDADQPQIADGEKARQSVTWRIRYRAIDASDHRITYGGKTYEITGVTETGGRDNQLIVKSYALDVA